jgi:hypothetical protein
MGTGMMADAAKELELDQVSGVGADPGADMGSGALTRAISWARHLGVVIVARSTRDEANKNLITPGSSELWRVRMRRY